MSTSTPSSAGAFATQVDWPKQQPAHPALGGARPANELPVAVGAGYEQQQQGPQPLVSYLAPAMAQRPAGTVLQQDGVSATTLWALRVVSLALAGVFLGALIWTFTLDGVFRGGIGAVATPLLQVALVDFYLNSLIIFGWVYLREVRSSSGLGCGFAAAIIFLMLIFGTLTTWLYVAHILWVRTQVGDTHTKIILG
jgi:hypothetical protein